MMNYPYYNPYGNMQNYPVYPPSQIQSVKFVNGRQEAEGCSLPLNSKAILMDYNRDIFYLKETDINGISSITEYSFQKVEDVTPNATSDNYITKEEFNQWKEQYESVISKLISEQESSAVSTKSTGTTVGLHKNEQRNTTNSTK